MWLLLVYLSVFLTLAYCILILKYNKWFRQLAPFNQSPATQPTTRFSVIIPARNEENNIENCILSVMRNHYPAHLYEVIIVDDFSTDNTATVVKKLQAQFSNLRLVQLESFVSDKLNSYKKKSIETGIAQSSFEWIITTDADCEVSRKWLSLFDSFIQVNDPVFIAAPVKFKNTKTFLSIFQSLDFISLQGITAASVKAGFHSMCNGANLAYQKKVFYAVSGFRDVDNIASGDDMLLMQKIRNQYNNKIGYLFNSDAIVSTSPMPDWKTFVSQRIRWASKATRYNDKTIFFVLLLVYVFNLCILLLPLLSFFNTILLFYWLLLLVSKISCELIFMSAVAEFFGQKKLLWWFPLMQPFHILYTVVAGWLGSFGKYEWKGRIVK